MLIPRPIFLLNIKRTFCDSSSSLLTAEFFCNQENRNKCMDKMRHVAKSTTTKLNPSVKVASVLIPLVNCDKNGGDEPSILYTLRSTKIRRHIGQVSFPGGIFDELDASYTDCALRETEEEIGIGRDRIELWGEASLVQLRETTAITPVIGMIHDYNTELLKINHDEVERVFTVPIIDLCRMKRHTQFRAVPGSVQKTKNTGTTNSAFSPNSFSMPVYTVDEARIWGITAIITHLFLQSLLPPQLYNRQIPYISKYK